MKNTSHGPREKTKKMMTRLRNGTRKHYRVLFSLPYFKAIDEHKLPLKCYVRYLKTLEIIYDVFENEIEVQEDVRVMLIWGDEFRRRLMLESDLAFFEPRIALETDLLIDATLNISDKIRKRGKENPVTLLGYLYAFESFLIGNCKYFKNISDTYSLSENYGCRYITVYRTQLQKKWKRISQKMNNVLTDKSDQDAAIDAAQEAFRKLTKLLRLLWPVEKQNEIFNVSRINPEAGNYPLPENELEIRAALNASQRTWEMFPYYHYRYGKRGKRFSDSDSCWLVTLMQLDQKNVNKQIHWISRLLAARGMPTVLLEKSLCILHTELVQAIPENEKEYKKLIHVAEKFKTDRFKRISEIETNTLIKEFERETGSELTAQYRNMGIILISAVTDEKNGMERAVVSLQDWFTNPKRFPPKWINAVEKLITNARSLLMD